MQDQVLLNGVPGSPYTRKMLAVLRYRRIPYRLILASHDAAALPRAKVRLLPTFYFPDAAGELQAVTDSTPIIRQLEKGWAGRSVRPSDPALALVDALLEDFGDEWLTKAMFHYRWAYEADALNASRILPNWAVGPMPDQVLAERGAEVARRQIERLRYVGSNPTTGPVIEASYIRFIELLEAHLTSHRFMLGNRPAAADFGAFGQLTQLAHVDPTPEAITRARAPRVVAWVGVMEDLSGHEPEEAGWFDAGALPASLTAILTEVGRVYAPLLLANARALRDQAQAVETVIDGQPWTQQPFAYQAKCLAWLREEHAALDAGARRRFDAAVAGTGCEPLFA
jgi:glutathione S-transferase